jgi:peptide alpha-N-acetyltransferase
MPPSKKGDAAKEAKPTTTTAGKPEASKSAAATPAPSQVLPSKESALFKQILRFYETKQYKKGIKTADTILAKFPLHGETIAMKGLTYNCMNKKDEARLLVKKGLGLNIKSHVCWHVYGLLYRSERAYNDAIKCYQNAIRIDPTNNEILKDLSLLQIQRRMTEGFAETRRKILMLKTNNRNNWIAYALGHHLSGKYKRAAGVIDAFNKTVDAKAKETKNYEHSEMMLYKNMILEESGDLEATLTHLSEIKDDVVDELHWLEKNAALHLALKRNSIAEREYRALLKINAENYAYHYGLACALGIISQPSASQTFSDDESKQLGSLYAELKKEFPDTTAVDRIPLNFLKGAPFETAINNYFTRSVRKGIPSLFRDLRSLYTDPEKVRVISNLLNSIIEQLTSSRRFTPDAAADSEAPSAIVWAWYYQIQHLDFMGRHDEALRVVDGLIAHTPTNLDAFMLKARLLKHVGEPILAHTYMDQARRMDTADRYLNTKCTRYALRADDLQVAENTVCLFLRDGDNLSSLVDMQCSWYENESGEMFVRKGEYGKALKQFVNVTKSFQDMEEDQFDFHSYCLRKMTLRAYIKMMRMEDNLKSHRFFVRAVRGIVNTYLRLYDLSEEQAAAANIKAQEGGDPHDLKAAEKKAKREAAKAAKKKS